MIRSKISRSILVLLFIAVILFLGFIDIKCMLGYDNTGMKVKLLKIGYSIGIVVFALLYVYIKDKLYRMKVKRSQGLIFRYIYLFIAVIVTSILTLTKDVSACSLSELLIYITLTVITAFVIKKVIFNVSKSDILSVFALLFYSMLPNIIQEKAVHLNSILITLTFFIVILVLQFLVDELKQRGIKSKKYIIYSVFLGLAMGLSSILGINILVWILLALVLLIITVHLDNTHINFPKAIMNSITQGSREKLYSVERLNINKLIISLLLCISIGMTLYFAGGRLVNKTFRNSNNEYVQIIVKNFDNNSLRNIKNIDVNANDILNKSKTFIETSKGYYLVLFIYILLVEMLNIILKRRYDTKSTILKMLFIVIFLTTIIFGNSIYMFQPLFATLLVLIALVNTSNIYLNREERIKMLVA